MMKNLTQSEKLFMLFQRGAIFVGRGRQMPHGGGHGQNYVLSLLAEAPLSQKELLEKLGVRAGSLSELLSKLENAGYITRTKDENDNRVANVAITEEGKRFAAEHGHRRAEAADSFFSVLTDEEKTTLTALLEKLTDAWRRERDEEDTERRGHGFGGFGGGHGFGGHGGFGKTRHGEFEHGGHHHRGEGVDPELKARLETLNCDECDKNCNLFAPQCRKGARKQQTAIEEFVKDKE